MTTLGYRWGYRIIAGALAGAAATTVLNLVTYLDMAVRGRPASDTPAESARRMARLAGTELESSSRADAVGALLGYAAGIGSGVAYGVLTGGRMRGLPAAGVFTTLGMLAGNAPMTLLGVTDPREWSATDWLTDVVPHLAYGVTGAVVYRLLSG